MKPLYSGAGPKIVVIGGGTGLSVLLRGLKNISDNLAAVVTMADDGGGSGMLREDLGMLPPGDVRSCLLALADMEKDFGDLMQYRFSEGMLEGQNIGNLILAALTYMAGSFEEGLEKAHDIFRIKGRVIPVTCHEITLCARLSGGTTVRGESNIPKTVLAGEGKIEKVFLEPLDVQSIYQARKAIAEAEVVVIGPGSLYTSLIPNFLVGGIVEELQKTNVPKILICNMMTQPGETDGFTVTDHIMEVEKYLGDVKINYVMVNSTKLEEEVTKRYAKNEKRAVQVMLCEGEKEQIEGRGIRVVRGHFSEVKLGYIRHNAEELSTKILGILREREDGIS